MIQAANLDRLALTLGWGVLTLAWWVVLAVVLTGVLWLGCHAMKRVRAVWAIVDRWGC